MEYQSIYFLLLVIVVLRTILLIPVDEFGTINRLTPQLREQNFSCPDFQVGVTLTLLEIIQTEARSNFYSLTEVSPEVS